MVVKEGSSGTPLELFLNIGLDERTARNTIANNKVTTNLTAVIHEVFCLHFILPFSDFFIYTLCRLNCSFLAENWMTNSGKWISLFFFFYDYFIKFHALIPNWKIEKYLCICMFSSIIEFWFHVYVSCGILSFRQVSVRDAIEQLEISFTR